MENEKKEASRTYYCIDMKSFFASVECAERGYNPMEAKLVVADVTRGKNALCLAVSPMMKKLDVQNRCRLSDIPHDMKFEIAPPRMKLYMDYAADIYALYLRHFDPRDIHVYSIDEAFIDVTDYLKMYHTDAVSLARDLLNEIAYVKGIPATAGIGTNLYLAKVADDITAKHAPDHIGVLDEESYCRTLWDHRPITDFWQIASGTAARLAKYGLGTMGAVAHAYAPLLYKVFGINAELLIDHAWGRESCTMADIKSYRTQTHSVSFSQILPRDYTNAEARVVVEEMVMNGCQELMRRGVITNRVWLGVGYARSEIPSVSGNIRVPSAVRTFSVLYPPVAECFRKITDPAQPIRRLAIAFGDVVDENCGGYDLFTDWNAVDREERREKAVLALQEKYGKNAVLRGFNYLPCATQRERNGMIGGHRAGYDDANGQSQAVPSL